jgi:hypothetical protein
MESIVIPVFVKFTNSKRVGGIFAKMADDKWHKVATVESEDEYHKFVKNWRKLHTFANGTKFSYGQPSA